MSWVSCVSACMDGTFGNAAHLSSERQIDGKVFDNRCAQTRSRLIFSSIAFMRKRISGWPRPRPRCWNDALPRPLALSWPRAPRDLYVCRDEREYARLLRSRNDCCCGLSDVCPGVPPRPRAPRPLGLERWRFGGGSECTDSASLAVASSSESEVLSVASSSEPLASRSSALSAKPCHSSSASPAGSSPLGTSSGVFCGTNPSLRFCALHLLFIFFVSTHVLLSFLAAGKRRE